MPARPLPEGAWGFQSEPLPTFRQTWPQAQAEIGAQWQKDRFFDPRRRQQVALALQQREQMQMQGQMSPQQRPGGGGDLRRQIMMDQLMSQRADREMQEMEPVYPYTGDPGADIGLMGASAFPFGDMGSPFAGLADEQIVNWLQEGVEAGAQGKQWPPREAFGDPDIIEASGGELTIEDLERLKELEREPWGMSDEEIEEYNLLDTLRSAARDKITGDAPEAWYYEYPE